MKKIIICSNYAWTIWNFRMPLIEKLKLEGYQIIVITQFDGYENKIQGKVDQMYNLFISRKGINPIIDLVTIAHMLILFSKINADFLICFTIKPVIYGSISARFFKLKTIVMITGLGTGFLLNNWVSKVVKSLYRFSLSNTEVVFFQNDDDKKSFIENGLVTSSVCRMSPGSGVDLDKFPLIVQRANAGFTFLLIARMLWDKGVGEFVAAARVIKKNYPNVRFQLLGPLGVQNRSSIPSDVVANWVNEGIVEYLGETDCVVKYIENASCIVLPSYREGTSRVLLEAASMGQPIIATDVPGCREVVEDGKNGFLCKSKSSEDLTNKLLKMMTLSQERRVEFGLFGRKKVEKEFNQDIVCQLYLNVLSDL